MSLRHRQSSIEQRSRALPPTEILLPRTHVPVRTAAEGPVSTGAFYGVCFRYANQPIYLPPQFEQFGVELFGHDHPSSDVEIIGMAWTFLKRLGLERSVQRVQGRSDRVPESECEQSERGQRETVSDIESTPRPPSSNPFTRPPSSFLFSPRSLTTNPLRILDSKHPSDRATIASSPLLNTFLSPTSRAHFDAILVGLDALAVPYVVSPRLVRGLDYYEGTVFEFVYVGTQEDQTEKERGLGVQQGTVLAGGRYDGLLGTMSGGKEKVPGIG
ncbi:hypothetical protein BC938DRAFT_480019 [Jimgerdemannia flammicorona]|uniref:histidine--tRNA ligase n=1 Tax=Jimgerdemannia flammicorona TaxID=994334 RepID=A0A433QJK9_9FUNG|nr:hypothetical protein BC938DRAFT_480019 [Jimgerdemannia flammicorona]